VQNEVIVNPGETALMFYRAYNAEPDPVIGFAIYNVYPEEAMPYFSKIQCFCFN
jgi:cytochrome c oxidase assembly protein subunit 11